MGSVLLISKQGDGIPLALRLAEEGHIVKVYIKEKRAKPSLAGYRNPKTIDKAGSPDQYDFILFDMAGMGQVADKLIKQDRFVIGGGLLNDKLELDRAYGGKICTTLTGLKMPNSILLKSKEQLLKKLESSTVPSVIKPLNNAPSGLTLVGMDGNRNLSSIVRTRADELLPCLVQDKIDGVEVSTEGWFNGEEFKCFNHTIEYKRFMEGDHGQNTGCMGNVVWACEEDELVKQALLPLTQFLKRARFVGPLDVNCIIQENDAYFLEWTPRFGYDAIQAYTELIKGSLFDFLWRFASQDDLPDFREDYGIAVRLSIPPYPGKEDIRKLAGMQVLDIQDGARNHLFLADVKKEEDEEVVAGVDGVIGSATARGSSITSARQRVYRTVNNCVIHPDVQFRQDIGAAVESKIEKLKVWGWL